MLVDWRGRSPVARKSGGKRNAKISQRSTLSFLCAALGLFTLSSCEEAAPLLLTGPGLVIAAPVGAAIDLADGSEIKQPVLVRSATGDILAAPLKGNPKASFLVDEATIICTGQHTINQPTIVFDQNVEGGYSSYSKIALKCNQGLKGLAFFTNSVAGNSALRAAIYVGPENIPVKQSGGQGNYILGETKYSCASDYRASASRVDPFRVKCDQGGSIKGAVAQGAQGQGPKGFTVWIFPGS